MSTLETPLSDRAKELRSLVEDPDRLLESCDGGDPGTPDDPSIWVFGLEPGWSKADEKNDRELDNSAMQDLSDNTVEWQLKWPFNRRIFWLLAALKGQNPRTYTKFALQERPFEKGAKGYLKGNLFPAACNNLDEWDEEHVRETGFDTKAEYQDWMREKRFPIIKSWIERCRPKLFIGVGTTYVEDFLSLTDTRQTPEPYYFDVNGHSKSVYFANDGAVPIAVILHPTGGSNGLNSYDSASKTAQYIIENMPGTEF